MDLFNTDMIGVWLVVALVAITFVVGTWAYRHIRTESKSHQNRKEKRQALESELKVVEDELHAERQRFGMANASSSVFMPQWAEKRAEELRYKIRESLRDAKGSVLDVSYCIREDELYPAKDAFGHFRRYLALAHKDICRLAGIQKWIERFRRNAERKAEAALSLVDEVEELGKAMSDRGIVLDIDAFDDLSRQVLWLEASIAASSGELLSDRSDEILHLAEELTSDAEKLQCSLKYVAALRAFVPKRIAEHQGRPDELMSRNNDAVRMLEHIKSFSAEHVWSDLGRQLNEVPGMLSRARSSFVLAGEMHANQSWLYAKQEAEAAVALADNAERIFDEISELDARLTLNQDTVTRYFGETKIAVESAMVATIGREGVDITAKQLALRAKCALGEVSRLVSDEGELDYIGAVESLGRARQYAEEALDHAHLDVGPDIDIVIKLRGQDTAEAPEPMPAPGFTGEYVNTSHGGAGGGSSQ